MSDDRIIRLAPGGNAPILSYNVPEPTSYSGRNYIDLKIEDARFKADPGLEPNGTLPQPQAVRAARAFAGDTDSLALDSRTGAAPVVDEPSFAVAAPDVYMLPIDDREPPPEPEYNSITFSSPANGATVTLPHNGGELNITGDCSADAGISKVEVQIGSGTYQRASVGAGETYSGWSYRAPFTAAGSSVIIRARLTASSGKTAAATRTINVSLAPAPDVTAPLVEVLSPADGTALVQSAGTTSVLVQGTATDARSGIASVDVSVNGGAWAPATALTAGFGSWSRALSFSGTGRFKIDVRCVDGAGNHALRTVNVDIVPRDTAKPQVAITSPASGTTITGGFDGVTVSLDGTATDDSQLASVAVYVNGNPAAITARPREGDSLSKWTAPATFSSRGPNTVRVVCTDVHGNENEATAQYLVELIPAVTSRLTRLILVESYRLSSFLGNYGAGRTLKTFSLLPGERTKISIKTFTRSEEDRKAASSILDSYTTETQEAFEKSMENEQTDRKSYQETEAYSLSAEAGASWGWGSASISASASIGTNAAREEFAKNISNATQKHVSEASAKRDVQINTSYEVKTSSGEETAVEREVQNANMSRTLNFVFRQMNQEFITLLHLVDVRVGYFKVIQEEGQSTDRYIYREVTLPQLYPLLQQVLNSYDGKDGQGRPDPDRYIRDIYNQILFQVMNIYDYRDLHHSFAEWRELADAEGAQQNRYLRVKKDYVSEYRDDAAGTLIRVPGIVMAANRYVMRTEGVAVEAILGQGDALDEYSHGLQDQAVRERRLANDRESAEVQRIRIANRILEEKDEEAARLYSLMTYAPVAVEAGEG